MNEKKLFFCSSSLELSESLNIIIKSAIKKEESIKKEKLSVKTPTHSKLMKWVAILRALRYFLSGKLSGCKTLSISYRNIPIGKYAVAASYRNPKSYNNRLHYYCLLIKNIAAAIVKIEDIQKCTEQIAACYVNDPSYLNGLYAEWSVKNRIPVYHNKYPYRLARFVIDKPSGFSEALLVQPHEKYGAEEISKGKNEIKTRLFHTESIEYMRDTKFSDYTRIETDVKAVIYCHSFTDAQQDFGGDKTFLNILEWLEFTIEKLKDKKIIIKAHPNFYKTGYKAKKFDYDRYIFEKFKRKIAKRKNIYLIDWSVRNYDVLQGLSKECVLISHHGNALLEGGYLGFKCITSSAAPWKKYNIFNEWQSLSEYEQMLANFPSLKPTDSIRLYEFMYDLCCSGNSFCDSRSWRVKAAQKIGVDPRMISKDSGVLKSLSDTDIERLTSDIADEIGDMYL